MVIVMQGGRGALETTAMGLLHGLVLLPGVGMLPVLQFVEIHQMPVEFGSVDTDETGS